MYKNIQLLLVMQSIISLTQAMHGPISDESVTMPKQLRTTESLINQEHNLVINIKQIAKHQKLDLKELCIECYHFKKVNGRLPIVSEAMLIAVNLKMQYVRQDEISQAIMRHLFDFDNYTQSLEGYQHADSILDYLDL